MPLNDTEHCVDEVSQTTVIQSSAARNWRGFHATLYEATGGLSDTKSAQHRVIMHLSAPTYKMIQCGDRVVRGVHRRGDLTIVPADVTVTCRAAAPSCALSVSITPGLLWEIAEGVGLNPRRLVFTPQIQISDKLLEHVCWALAEELQSLRRYSPLYGESLGMALASQLVRGYAIGEASQAHSLPSQRLQAVFDYVQEHLGHDLSLSELSAVAGLSGSYLQILFKEFTGVSVHRYVMRARLQRAFGLVTRTTLPLCDVASQCGFTDQSHFTRTFRRFYEITPAQLRQNGSN